MKIIKSMAALAVGAWCSPAPYPIEPCGPIRFYWPSFQRLKYVFTFGDSYTTTGFDSLAEPFPTAENPLGNPVYPGLTSANGPNWVDYLTVKSNASSFLTYNLAIGGASVFDPAPGSLAYQVQDRWYSSYVQRKAPGAPTWRNWESLFAIWIGINDINNSYERGPDGPDGTIELNKRIIAQYLALLEFLRTHGARNFVLLDVPALHRSPLVVAKGEQAQELMRNDVLDFNARLKDMAITLKKTHGADVNVWYAETYDWFNEVLDEPESKNATRHLKNLDSVCEGYQFGTPEEDTFKEECGVPVNQYFWLNSFHPTGPIHEVVANEIETILNNTRTVDCPNK